MRRCWGEGPVADQSRVQVALYGKDRKAGESRVVGHTLVLMHRTGQAVGQGIPLVRAQIAQQGDEKAEG